MLPFTREQFLAIFAHYNLGIWPVQVFACLLAAAAIVLLLRPTRWSDRVIGGGLALLWSWTGVVYHWMYFATINGAAWLFGALFVAQALLFLHFSVARNGLRFRAGGGAVSWIGWAYVAYAALVYPLLGLATGHPYPEMPMFGVTPCPLTIFTFGLLLLTAERVSRWLLAIPLAWSLVGGSAAFLLGVVPDWPLLASGLAILLLELRDRGILRQQPAT